MTNNEILQASLLDILFNNRNKDYGAYKLRKDYNHRLLIALGGALSIVLFFVLLNFFHKKEPVQELPVAKGNEVIIRTIIIPEEPKKQEPPRQKVEAVQKIAQIKSPTFKIVPDKLVPKNLPLINEIKGKIISEKNVDGPNAEGTKIDNDNTDKNAGKNGTAVQTKPEPTFIPIEKDPEFPGGQEALMRFLKNNLSTPEDLQAGEKKIVQVRFKVGVDGTVSTVEIVQSGGSLFDREVARVCKKMPHWKPALQNGVNVAVSYILPVTFIGVEQ
ncbi:MAG: energy transducer TonB [Chitinophagales bacterium]